MRSVTPALPLLLQASAVAAGHFNWDIIHFGVVDSFKWSRSWPSDGSPLNGFDVPCEHEVDYRATQYQLSDLKLQPPKGIAPWATELNDLFTSRAYPGSWDGVNLHGDHREVIMFEYKDVPELVRDYIDEQLRDPDASRRRFFGVYEKLKKGIKKELKEGEAGEEIPIEHKVLFIAPGELYSFLPLWVAKGSKCEGKPQPLRRRPS